MRVLIVNSGLRYGGAEKQIVELSKTLARRGHAVLIYTLTDDVPRLPELAESGVEVVVDNKRSKLDPGVLGRLRKTYRRFRPDIVHGFLYDGNIYSRVAAAGTGIPVLNSERNDNYALRRSQIWPHRFTRHLADGLVANTWAGRDFAKNLFRLPDSKLHVVWNGINLAEVDRRIEGCHNNYRKEFFAEAPGEQLRIACLVGTILPSKDHLLALEVAQQLTARDPRWRVLFVGDTINQQSAYRSDQASASASYRELVLSRFADSGLADKVIFCGQRSDTIEIMSQMDVLFSTSVHEGFPNVVLEAMAAGLPAVAVEYSDIRRILPASWQVVDRNAEAIADGILHACENRADVARAQRSWVSANATIDRAADELERVYQGYLR